MDFQTAPPPSPKSRESHCLTASSAALGVNIFLNLQPSVSIKSISHSHFFDYQIRSLKFMHIKQLYFFIHKLLRSIVSFFLFILLYKSSSYRKNLKTLSGLMELIHINLLLLMGFVCFMQCWGWNLWP